MAQSAVNMISNIRCHGS